ncbi:hypothetical protein F5877DRAFT_76085 [Lentinula edodes]|nr:hypothetical protein F5877DRAFT_76085 [Lentinula edodes]
MAVYTSSNMIALIHNLPNEILSEIFLCYTCISCWPTLKLTHVCSHWRDVALGTQELWSNITISHNSFNVFYGPSWEEDARGVLPLVELYLERSKTALLDITLEFPSMVILSALMRHSHRWRSVTLQVKERFCETKIDHYYDLSGISGRIPKLQVLSLCYPALDLSAEKVNIEDTILRPFTSAPKLVSIKLFAQSWDLPAEARSRSFPVEALSFTWRRLTSVTINCVALAQVKPILILCPRLEHADFYSPWNEAKETIGIIRARSQLYETDKLKHFSLNPWVHDISAIAMHTWILPSLETLILTHARVREITALLQRSYRHTLRKLSLHDGEWTSIELFELFQNTPLLDDLLLRDNPFYSENTFDNWLLREMTYPEPDVRNSISIDTQLLPRLQYFQYMPPKSCNVNGNTMVDMIVSRSRGSPSGAAASRAGMAILRQAHLGEPRLRGHPILNNNSIRKLEKVRREGMKVFVEGFRSTSGSYDSDE